MSFNVEARTVRDDALPFGRRVAAFARCLEHYSPIGFDATWAFLAHLCGDVRADPDALVAALGLLEQSRGVRAVEEQEYADSRRREKGEGRRTPPAGATSPERPRRWHADPAGAAAFTLAWHRQRSATGRSAGELQRRAFMLLEDAARGPAERSDVALAELDALIALHYTSRQYAEDPRRYFQARQLGRLAEQVRVLLGRY